MLAIAMALAAALSWGTGDFYGGISARRFAMPLVLLGTATGGTLFAAIALLIAGDELPPGKDLLIAVAAGFAGLLALGAFYRALAIGRMSIVAPVSASGTAIPVAVGIADGDPITALTATGFVLTIGGVMLASREQQNTSGEPEPPTEADSRLNDHQRSILLSCVAATGFGLIFVLIERASHDSILWPALVLKTTTLTVMIVIVGALAAARRMPAAVPSGIEWGIPLMVGTLDVTANLTYAYASTHGALSVTAVLASMFPVVTVLLAHQLLGERLIRLQKAGVVLALTGVVLLAAA
ncbi:MAG: DMT family transporter [Actinobacteria bacterium]|nr:DMT family transporter [Actinomycetota bacterium]